MDFITVAISQFHFIRPAWLWLLVPCGVILILLSRSKTEQQSWTEAIAPHLRTFMITGDSDTSTIQKGWLMIAGLCIAILALSGPTWEKITIPDRETDAGIVIVLDLSASMNATDIQPSRLKRAKLKIQDLVSSHASSRIGLVAYAGSAHTVVSPTRNSAAILLNLERLRTSIMPVRGSDVGPALILADSLLHNTSGSIVVVTDSPDEESMPVSRMLSDSTDHQQVFWLFATAQGAPIPEGRSGRFVRSSSGATVLSVFDERTARAFDALENVHVVMASTDARDVRKLNSELSNRSRAVLAEGKESEEWKDRGDWLLYPLVMFVLFWFRRGWVLQWSWVFALSVPLFGCNPDGPLADYFWTPDQRGQQFINRGDSLQGARVFEDPLYAGYVFYGAGENDPAINKFTTAFTADGLYNAGMVQIVKADELREPEWREKVALYRNAIMSLDESIRLDSIAQVDTGSPVKRGPTGMMAEENRILILAEVDRLLARFTGGDSTELTKSDDADGTQDKPETEDGLSEEESDEGGAAPPDGGGAQEPSDGPGPSNDDEPVYSDDELRSSVLRTMNPDPSVYLKRKFLLQIRNAGPVERRRLDPW